MRNIFDNLINGNLTAAKKSAKLKTSDDLITFAHIDLGWDIAVAVAAGEYLKDKNTFQNYCDIELAVKNKTR